MMSMTALGLCFLGLMLSAADQSNLALERPYTYYPFPNYHHCKDEADITQLTDGQTRYGGGMWMFPSTVGWAVGIDEPVVIHFDLERSASLAELRFNSVGGGSSGVAQVGLSVYVSLDDESYVLAGQVAPPTQPNEGISKPVQLRVPLKNARARYIAVVSVPPRPHHFTFVDEIEIIGTIPADSSAALPIVSSIKASGAQGLHDVLLGASRSLTMLENLTAPVSSHIASWPKGAADEQKEKLAAFMQDVSSGQYVDIKAALIADHRDRARNVYGVDTLVWEVPPDERVTPLSLPMQLRPPLAASVHTVVNAMEATALVATNLTQRALPLRLSVASDVDANPEVSARVARFSITTNAMYVADALIALDSPHTVPPGESKLIWLGVVTSDQKPRRYQYQVKVQLGANVHYVDLTVHVHNVKLSETTPLATGNWAYLNTGQGPLLREVRD